VQVSLCEIYSLAAFKRRMLFFIIGNNNQNAAPHRPVIFAPA
jgi:hypothetical protein